MAEAKEKTKPEESSGEDPWSAFTPDSLMDGVADRLWQRMGAKDDGENGETGEVEPEPVIEKPPAPIHKGARFLSFWMGDK